MRAVHFDLSRFKLILMFFFPLKEQFKSLDVVL